MPYYGWTWKNGTPSERGDWVRASLKDVRYDKAELRRLFNLTEDGVEKILTGDVWRPEYSEAVAE